MIAGVVLAAGAGSRFLASQDGADRSAGGSAPWRAGAADHKLVAPFRGKPLASWAIEAAAEAGFDHVLVVSGAVELDGAIGEAAGGDAVRVLSNSRWAEGQATSLALAVDEARRLGCRAVVVGLADQPLVPASAWRAVGAAVGPIVTATFDGSRRPPVKLGAAVWGDLPTTGDEGARTVMRLRPELVSELPCNGNPIDIDTVEDLQRWS
ncbi:MAG: nucleotidyltransferase family protein [Actinomycetota bacterium]